MESKHAREGSALSLETVRRTVPFLHAEKRARERSACSERARNVAQACHETQRREHTFDDDRSRVRLFLTLSLLVFLALCPISLLRFERTSSPTSSGNSFAARNAAAAAAAIPARGKAFGATAGLVVDDVVGVGNVFALLELEGLLESGGLPGRIKLLLMAG